jgi:hypothetical protein
MNGREGGVSAVRQLVVWYLVAYEGCDAEWGAEVDRGGYVVVCHLAEALLAAFMYVCGHAWQVIPRIVAPLNWVYVLVL